MVTDMLGIVDLFRGDVLVTIGAPRDPLHLAIDAVLDEPFPHVTSYAGSGAEFSTAPGGLVKREVGDEWLIVRRYDGDPAVLNHVMAALAADIGRPYNFEGGALLGLSKLTGFDATSLLGDHHARFCSEGLSDYWVQAGDDLLPWVEDGKTTPGDFALTMKLRTVGILHNDLKGRGAVIP